MRIVILSRDASIPSTARLVEAAKQRGHQVRVLNPVRVEMHLDGTQAGLSYQRKKMRPCDVVIPRIAPSISAYGLAVVSQFALRGCPVLNSAQAIGQARNKMRALQLLSAHGVDIPTTVMARDAADLKAMAHLVGGVPVLVKLLQGPDRHGVMVCETLQSLEAALEAILGLGHDLVLQQYVKKGQDIRLFVVGGEVVAAVRRHPRVGRLSRTLNRGARMSLFKPTLAQRRAALAAARVIGLEVAAVDMLDADGIPKVFEVNSSPALQEIERITGVDVAARMIARAEQLVLAGRQSARSARAIPAIK